MGKGWAIAEKENRIFNAIDICKVLKISSADLYEIWSPNSATTATTALHMRLRHGLHVARFDHLSSDIESIKPPASLENEGEENGKNGSKEKGPIWIINGFYPSMRDSYTSSSPSVSVNYMVVEWDSTQLSWSVFMADVLGARDPSMAFPASIRGSIFNDWQRLGLPAPPTLRDNCVHASASALAGLRERLIWIPGSLLFTDLFGSRLLAARIPSSTIKLWLDQNPFIHSRGAEVSEIMLTQGAEECIALATEICMEEMKVKKKRIMGPKLSDSVSMSSFKVLDEISAIAKEGVKTKRSSAIETSFVFIKPHASSNAVISHVRELFERFGVNVTSQGKLAGSAILSSGIFEKQFVELEANAILFDVKDIFLAEAEHKLFFAKFDISWKELIKQKKLLNMKAETLTQIGLSSESLNDLCLKSAMQIRIRKGLYIFRIDELPKTAFRKAPIWIINGFYPSLRDSYVSPLPTVSSVNYMVVEWDSTQLSWSKFMTDILGSRDCSKAKLTSIRGSMFRDWQRLGLPAPPTLRDNCVHASASALAGLRERLIWIRGSLLFTDLFGSRLLAARIPSSTIKLWIENSASPDGGVNSVLSQLREQGVENCITYLLELLMENKK